MKFKLKFNPSFNTHSGTRPNVLKNLIVRTKLSTTFSVTSMYGITHSPQFEMSQNVARLPVPQNEIEFVTQNMSFAGKDIFCNNAKDDRTISHKLRYLCGLLSLQTFKFHPSFNTYSGTRPNMLNI